MVTDGGYCGYENVYLAHEKNINLVTTDLKELIQNKFILCQFLRTDSLIKYDNTSHTTIL